MKRYNLTNRYSFTLRKYVKSTLLFLIAGFLLWYGSVGLKIVGIILAVMAIFFSLLKFISFDDEFIYITDVRYDFDQLVAIKGIEIGQIFFPCLIMNDNGRKRRFYTDIGKSGLLSILLGLIFPVLDPLKNLKRFNQLAKEKSSIKTTFKS